MKTRMIKFIIFFVFIVISQTLSAETEPQSDHKRFYFDAAYLYSYGTGLQISNSSSNWDKKIEPSGNAHAIQLSLSFSPGGLYYKSTPFFGIGSFAEYLYFHHELGDIRSLSFGVDLKVAWILKMQIGMGRSYSNSRYQVEHGYNWNSDTAVTDTKFDEIFFSFGIGLDIPIVYNINLELMYRDDSYEGPIFSAGHDDLSRTSICFGLKAKIFSFL